MTVRNVSGFAWRAAWWLACGTASAPLARAQERSTTYQFPLKALDLAVQSSSRSGVQLMGSPNVWSNQGDSARVVWLTFHQDTVRAWLDHAAVVLRSPLVTAPQERVQWSRSLPSIQGKGGLLVGRTVKGGKLRNRYWMTLGDSTQLWHLEIEREEADSLLQLLLTASAESRLVPDDSTYTGEQVTSPVEVIRMKIEADETTRPGRVFVYYVIGPDGKADPASINFRLVSHPDMERLARSAILKAVFKPAMIDGVPVRQAVYQSISVNPGGRRR